MVRYLPLANGRLKVSFDRNHRIADFYFSEFATENHAGGSTFRHGISVNGDFRWVDSDIIRNMTYFDHTLVGNVVYEVDGLTVENFDPLMMFEISTLYFPFSMSIISSSACLRTRRRNSKNGLPWAIFIAAQA